MTTKGVAVLDKLKIILPLAALLVLALSPSAGAAPSVLGTSGNILTPDDTIVAPGGVNFGYHAITDFAGGSDTLNIYCANIGLLPKLEVGAAVVTNGGSEVIINGKYRILSEGEGRPAVTVGLVDAGAQLTHRRGAYILLSKNLTTFAEELADKISRPLRGHLGIGNGAVKDVFVGLDWTLAPKFSLMAEYISDSELTGSDGEALLNAGIRYALTKEWRLDLGMIDFEDFTFGASYQALKF